MYFVLHGNVKSAPFDSLKPEFHLNVLASRQWKGR